MPARFTVQITPSFRRDLETLPTAARKKILEALHHLEANPFGPPKVKRLKGRGIGHWRLEVWPYRVRYDVEGQNVVLYRVRQRKDIYRGQSRLTRASPSLAPGAD